MRKFTNPFDSTVAGFLFAAVIALGTGSAAWGQNGVAINDDGADPNANAALDVKSPATGAGKGMLIPRVTAAQRTTANASLDGGLLDGSGNLRGGAAQGLMVYQTDGSEGFYYNTSKTAAPTWVYLGANVGTVTSVTAASPLTGGAITSSGTIGINQASAAVDGYLSKTDWSTFNGKGSSNLALGATSTTACPGDTGAAAYAASVTSATSSSTPSTLVKRDASGNFSAGTVTANLAASGGTINGTTIGATTPAAGSFTTLNSSGATAIGNGAVTLGAAGASQVGKIIMHDAQAASDFTLTLQAPDTIPANITFKWPSADGTNGQVLSTNGTGVLSFITAGGGGSATLPITGTAVTVGDSAVTSDNGVSVGVSANSTTSGAAVGYQSNATIRGVSVGYMANGYGGAGLWSGSVAVGYRANGYGYEGKRSGGVAIGYQANARANSSSSDYGAVAVGYGANGYVNGVGIGAQATGYYQGVAVGWLATGTQQGVGIGYMANGYVCGTSLGYRANSGNQGYAVAKGGYSRCMRYNEEWKGSDTLSEDPATGQLTGYNKYGAGQANFHGATSNATATEIFLANSTGKRFTLQDNSALCFTAMCVGVNSTTGDSSVWKISGGVKRRSGAATTALISTTDSEMAKTSGTLTTAPTFTADTTNGALKVTVTGVAASTVRWNVRLVYSEVRE